MPAEDIEMNQENFMRTGGLYVKALSDKWKSGELKRSYDFQEYPKLIRLPLPPEKVTRSTEDVKGKTITWEVTEERYREILVHSEEEEDRVTSGGVTSGALEEERQSLIVRARNAGIKVDLAWSALRLKRELGEKFDAPEPIDQMDVLKEKLARLEEIEALKAKIALLERPDEAETMRQQLVALGVTPDKRWGAARLREELDAATAPAERVA